MGNSISIVPIQNTLTQIIISNASTHKYIKIVTIQKHLLILKYYTRENCFWWMNCLKNKEFKYINKTSFIKYSKIKITKKLFSIEILSYIKKGKFIIKSLKFLKKINFILIVPC